MIFIFLMQNSLFSRLDLKNFDVNARFSSYHIHDFWFSLDNYCLDDVEIDKKIKLINWNTINKVYYKKKQWKTIATLFVQVMKTNLRMLKQKHSHMLINVSNLTLIYWNQTWWKKIEKLFVQIVKMRLRILKQKHLHTLIDIVNFAFTWKFRICNHDVVSLLTKCLQLHTHKLSFEHFDTKSSLEFLNKWQMKNLTTNF